MRKLIFTILLSSCAINRAESKKLLEVRADYDAKAQIKVALKSLDEPLLVPTRTEPVMADIWVHPHELASGDYFRGGWIRTLVSPSGWKVEEVRHGK